MGTLESSEIQAKTQNRETKVAQSINLSTFNGDLNPQLLLDLLDDRCAVGMLGQSNVEAIELPEAAEAPLRRRNVDERHLAAQRRRR